MLFTKLKTKASQKTTILDYKINMGSDGNLIHINMLRTPFPKTPIAELNKYIDKTSLCAYNNSCIPQLGKCKVIIKHKNIELPCDFFVLPTHSPAAECELHNNGCKQRERPNQ